MIEFLGRFWNRRAEAERSEDRFFRSAFSHAAIGMALVAPDGRFLKVNRSLCQLVGYDEAELLSRDFQTITHAEDLDKDLEFVRRMLAGEIQTYQMEKRYIRKDGREVWALLSVSLVRERQGRPEAFISQIQDIDERKRAELKLQHDALHDPLTGLPNRAFFKKRLGEAMERQKQGQAAPVVLFMDLDRFKIINDSLGHAVGDQLLLTVARKLREGVEQGGEAAGMVARLGGDEFVVMLEGIRDVSEAGGVARRLLGLLVGSERIGGHEVYTSASIGIAMGEAGCTSPDDLIRDADTAMYHAKAQGKAAYVVFDDAMRAEVMSRMQLENDLHRAVQRDEIFIHYQPILTLEDGRVRGFEALARWQHPKHGAVEPAVFIALAEETGLVIPLGDWVLRQALERLARWRSRYPEQGELFMSVNLSRRQFYDAGLCQRIKDALRHAGVEADSLRVEVSESSLMHDRAAAMKVLDELRRIGVSVDVDDFGAGHSSLTCLNQFPLSAVKIHESFVKHLRGRRDLGAVMHSLILLARNLGLRVVAEGVENSEQVSMLQALDCEYAQGFYFAPPLPADRAECLLVTPTPRVMCA